MPDRICSLCALGADIVARSVADDAENEREASACDRRRLEHAVLREKLARSIQARELQVLVVRRGFQLAMLIVLASVILIWRQLLTAAPLSSMKLSIIVALVCCGFRTVRQLVLGALSSKA